jgi:formylglycine-generating enzyme required for sulfatase activity
VKRNNVFLTLLLFFAMFTVQTQIIAQDEPEVKPSLAVFVVGMESNEIGDFLAILMGNELSNGERYDVITSADIVQRKLKELREYEHISGNVNENELLKWGRQNDVSMLCLVSSVKLDEYVFTAQLTDVESNKLVGSSYHSCADLSSADLKKTAETLVKSLSESLADLVAKQLARQSRNKDDNAQRRESLINSAGKKNGDTYNPDGIELVYVEGSGGTLGMYGFYIGKYEVTQAQYQKVMGDNPSGFKAADNPVENVSWNDVQMFLDKLNTVTGRNYRLPTEEEWVYAANGGTKFDTYMYAGGNNLRKVARFADNSKGKPHPAGSRSSNSIDIYDMSGNVWEWCQDYYDNSSYDSRSYDRVIRGGGWGSDATYCRIDSRDGNAPDNRGANLGFRVVLD